ncbi:hypothetical protein ACOME3_004367 [Neoechinorhynchus agilis]
MKITTDPRHFIALRYLRESLPLVRRMLSEVVRLFDVIVDIVHQGDDGLPDGSKLFKVFLRDASYSPILIPAAEYLNAAVRPRFALVAIVPPLAEKKLNNCIIDALQKENGVHLDRSFVEQNWWMLRLLVLFELVQFEILCNRHFFYYLIV